MMNVSVFALGRTGLPLSLVCADRGLNVIGIDINKELVDQIKKGDIPFYEPEMKELLDKHLDKNFTPTDKILPDVVIVHKNFIIIQNYTLFKFDSLSAIFQITLLCCTFKIKVLNIDNFFFSSRLHRCDTYPYSLGSLSKSNREFATFSQGVDKKIY